MRLRTGFLLFSALLFVMFSVGCWGTGSDTPGTEESEQLYTCGMHPQVVQHEPGECPICGMNLTPMQATTQSEDTVVIPSAVQQQMGVETAPVQETTVFRHLRTIGIVDVGEDELSVVNLRYSGWIEKIRVDRTGDAVKSGQTLFEIYSPELVSAQEEFLLALRTQGADSNLTHSARRKLELWDLSGYDIDQIAKGGASKRTMPVRSPSDGFVLHKNVVEGARVQAGQDLYRIGNLKRVWVTAEVYEHDAPWIEEGQPAQMELSNALGQTVDGEVAYVYPTMNEKSRTLPVRLEFDNPGVRLKPGMFATVYIQYRRKDAVIAVPTEAIIHSGRRQIVFVALGQGRFGAREITTGLVGDHRMTEVLSGLEVGDTVVVSGQFLIDSESQLQEAIRKIVSTGNGTEAAEAPTTVWSCPMHPEVLADERGKCPECGMFLEERPGTSEELHTVWEPAGALPGQYTCPMHPEIVEEEAGRCPKCGMFLEQVPAEANHEGHDHGGEP